MGASDRPSTTFGHLYRLRLYGCPLVVACLRRPRWATALSSYETQPQRSLPPNHPGRRSPTTGSGRAVPQGDRLDHLLGSGLVPSVTAMADPFIDVT